ncbi:gamma-aminobutyric acid type B receptor subunit 2-like isoform X2 [Oculina patagonica]
MKGKVCPGVLLGLACILVLAQNAAYCRSQFETYADLCCEKLSNSSDLRCWNKTQEKKNTTNTTTLAQCTQKMAMKACFNVTAVKPCQDDPAENILDPGKKEIHIGAFVPFLTDDRYGYSNAMKMAIALINNRTDILDNYTLVLDSEDSHWDNGAYATVAFFKLLNKNKKPVILLGPSSTKALEPVAEAAPLWKLVQVSYASGSPKFESRLLYPNTYRAAPSSTSYSKAKVAFIKHYGWKRVAILHEYDPEFFSPTVAKLKVELEKNNISIIAVEGFEQRGDLSFQMEKLKSLDARIIIGEFGYVGARYVFCEAFKQKMYGSHYAWVIFGELKPIQIFPEDSKLGSFKKCKSDELKQAADRYISTIKLDIRQDDHKTLSGMTSESFWSEMVRLNNSTRLRKDSAYAFDAAWVIALTLNASFADGMTYENLQKRTWKEVLQIKKWIANTNFQGITGPVGFDQNKERVGTVLIKQNKGGDETRIGQHFTFSDELHIFDSQRDSIWPDNKPPKDHTVQNLEFMMIPLPLIIIMWLMAAVGIICSASFLYFNISNGKNRIIKMSSPKLNNIIILGCILCYASVVLLGLDARFLTLKEYGNNCNARTAVLSVGFSLSFGAMFSKTWRVHKIFTAAKTLKKMAIKDLHLLVIVAGLLAVDVVFLSCWIAIDPLQAEILTFKEMSRKEQDTIILPALYQCTCQYKTYFLGGIFAYKGILLLFGLFLAWETRNVTIPALNDSRYIGMSVYNVVVLSIIGAIVAIALDGSMYYEAPYAISSLCLIVCTTATLLLVFVPKIYQFLMKDETLTTQASSMHVGQTRTRAHSHSLTCGSPVLKERQTSFTCKATQTDCDVPGSAGPSTLLIPLIESQAKYDGQDLNV